MISMNPRLRTRLFQLFVSMFVLLVPIQPVSANTKPGEEYTSYFWRAYVSFPKDKLQVEWIVAQLDYDAQLQLIAHKDIIKRDISEDCSIIQEQPGGVVIRDERAFFDGGYIHCTLPDFQKVMDEWLDEPGSCDCESVQSPAWFAAQFGTKLQSSAGQVLPLLLAATLPPDKQPETPEIDWRFQLQTQENILVNTQTLLDEWIGNPGNSNVFTHESESGSIAFSGYGANVYARVADFKGRDHFMDIPEFQQAARQSQLWDFLAWVQGEEPVKGPISLDGIKKKMPTDLYIGYNGIEYFRGWISDALADPGCRAH